VKSSDGEVTVSGVTSLDASGRVRELARMLGGMAESGTAQAHAQELLEAAEQERSATQREARHSGRRGRARQSRAGERGPATSQASVRPSSGEDAPAAAPTRS